MKFYKAGKKVRNIDDLKKGETYSVCGIVGVFTPVASKDEQIYAFEAESEGISLVISRSALMDRAHLGMVYAIKKEIHPREKTLIKMLSISKK